MKAKEKEVAEVRCCNSIIDSMNMNFSKLYEAV